MTEASHPYYSSDTRPLEDYADLTTTVMVRQMQPWVVERRLLEKSRISWWAPTFVSSSPVRLLSTVTSRRLIEDETGHTCVLVSRRRLSQGFLAWWLVTKWTETTWASELDEVVSTTLSSGGESRKITDRVTLDVAVNGVEIGTIVLGLYGALAPRTVAEFLALVPGVPRGRLENKETRRLEDVHRGLDDEGKGPTYRKSVFYRRSNGCLLEGGRIRNLKTVVLRDKTFYDFFGMLMPAQAQLETTRMKHDRRGLLTKEIFHVGPEWGITLAPASQLDGTHCVYGEVLAGDDILLALEEIPIQTDRSMEPEGSFADNLFRFQKNFFLKLGREVFRDKRALETFPGKLLRRVEVSSCAYLQS